MLKIALDIDDTILQWRKTHEDKFGVRIGRSHQDKITKQVNSLKNNRKFWTSLPLLETPDFNPICYCTKRVNPKEFTITSLHKNNLPICPIIQFYNQTDNKADGLKGVADVLIDDSWYNVQQCLSVGMPALLISRPHNRWVKTSYRVSHLNYKEIESKYNELFR